MIIMTVKSDFVNNFLSDGGAGSCTPRTLVDEARFHTKPPPSHWLLYQKSVCYKDMFAFVDLSR